MKFCPRPPAAGAGREDGKLVWLRREHSKLPKNLKTNRLKLYFKMAKIFFKIINNE